MVEASLRTLRQWWRVHLLRLARRMAGGPAAGAAERAAAASEAAAMQKAQKTHGGMAPVPRWGLTLFWRTFIMVALLLTMSTVGWLMTIRSVDFEPRATQTAQQIATLVNLSRAALVYSDSIGRYSLIKTLAEEESVQVQLREPSDHVQPIHHNQLDDRVTMELKRRLGPDTVVASSVNDIPGLWVSFDIDGDAYWLQTDQSRLMPVGGTTWLVWMLMAGGLSLAGAALMTGLVNRPLKQLQIATSKIREGDFNAGHLDESVSTKEIRAVNIGFNRMAEQMAQVEQERVVMLAGISHDLRTPLARLRLEVEMSVPDEESRKFMAADIEQVDSIINKFMDYARPETKQLAVVALADVVQTSVYPYQNGDDVTVEVDVPDTLRVRADEVELARVVSNLLENARRYGKTPDTEVTQVSIVGKAEGGYVRLRLRDHGRGVPAAILDRLTQPFYRADEARTAAVGSGLGLAIVKKVVEHMGGTLVLSNHPEGGLQADLSLPRAK